MNIELIKAFTKNPEEGNPAGVIFDADRLSQNKMIEIAAKLGYSESVFIFKSSSKNADYRFRFMTSITEVDACGHATLAASQAIYEQQPFQEITIETSAGLVNITRKNDGILMMRMSRAELGKEIYNKDEIANLLNINSDKLLDLPIITASVGSPKLMIPIKDLKSVEFISPNFDLMIEFCKRNPVKGFYIFTQEVIKSNSDFHARQFNPAAGILEDPITGIAGGALALYVKKYILDKNEFIIEQGFEMYKPGQIITQILNGDVYVGGNAVKFGNRQI